MIEEQIDNLEKEVEELRTLLFYIAKKVVPKSIGHTTECIVYNTRTLAAYGKENVITCYCNSKIINKILDLQQLPVLYSNRIKEILKEFKKANKE